MNKYTKGFTLIEMLIVVAVIAILAGVVLTGVSGFQSTARDTARIADMRNAQNFLELYFNRCGHYPGGLSGGACNTTNPSANPSGWVTLKNTMQDAKFTSNFPGPSVSAFPYYYGVGPNNLSYVIGAELENENNALKEDVDGTVYSVPCADAANSLVFCIQS